MRTFTSLQAATVALAQFGYVFVAAGPCGFGFSKAGGKHAVVSQRGARFVVKFV